MLKQSVVNVLSKYRFISGFRLPGRQNPDYSPDAPCRFFPGMPPIRIHWLTERVFDSIPLRHSDRCAWLTGHRLNFPGDRRRLVVAMHEVSIS